jgi:Ser/Thr protein kinase RdoA (MazF antagonist)
MSGLYDDMFVETLRRGAQSLVGEWGLSAQADVALLTVSENATFVATDPGAPAPVILRVHRPGYHTRAEIESELAWIDALRAEAVAAIPRPLPCRSGGHIAGFSLDGETRDVVAFSFMDGSEPATDAGLANGFRDLGAISARLHGHARRWRQPAGFVRKTWDFATTVGPTPHWGDWRAALGLTQDGQSVLERACVALEARLGAYGKGDDRWGLIHADLRLANLLVEDGPAGRGRIGVIDFDDCGFGWFMYDFAAAISFIETDPLIPDLQAAWIEGYRTIAPLPAEDAAMLPTFIMLRRLLLTAWIASHAETPTALEFGPGYTDGTIAIAERYLADAAAPSAP